MISRYAIAVAILAGASAPALAQSDPSNLAQQAGASAPQRSVENAAALAEAREGQDEPATQEEAGENEIVVTGNFLDDGSKSAMKMDVPVLDTPFSVASYSEAFVKSLETQNVADLYNYMTGLKKSGVTAYDITLRGFKSSGDDRNAIMVDGLPGMSGRYGSPPTIGVDHIELVKGPMSVLYGQIQPGGFVNLITKKPKASQQTVAELRTNTYASPERGFGDHNSISGAVDVTGPISSGISYRVVGQLTMNKGFRDYDYTDQEFLAPSLAFEIGPETTLTLQGEYRRTQQHFDIGVAAPFDGATSATSTIYDINAVGEITDVYTQPDNYRVETGKTGSAYLVHDFGDWKVNVAWRHVRYNSDQQDISSTGVNRYGGPTGMFRVTRRARQLQTEREYDYGDVNLTGTFATGPIEHKVLLGLNGGRDKVRENRLKFFNGATRNVVTGVCPAGGICLDIPLYNPGDFYGNYPTFDSLPAVNPADSRLLTDRHITQRNYGIYFSDLITFTNWLKVSASARKFRETTLTYADKRNAPNNVGTRVTEKDFLPSVGVLIQPNSNITIYGSYAESFVPVDPGLINLQGTNEGFFPITGSQYEVGVKTEDLLDGRLNFTTAIYQIENTGQVTQTICPFGSCSVQLGAARSRGFEFESNATPLDNWQVIFGYTYIDAKVLSGGPGFEFQTGRRLPNVAEHAANLWTRYDWENGFGVGLGVTYTGQREGVLPTQANDLKRLDLPAYTVVDVGLYYTKDIYSVNLKIGNLFNETYFENSGGGSQGRVQIQPGQPRYLTLTGRVSF